jgi:hypothetical protein
MENVKILEKDEVIVKEEYLAGLSAELNKRTRDNQELRNENLSYKTVAIILIILLGALTVSYFKERNDRAKCENINTDIILDLISDQ